MSQIHKIQGFFWFKTELKAVKNKNFVKTCWEKVPMSPNFPALLNQYSMYEVKQKSWNERGEVSKHNYTARCEEPRHSI